MKSGTQLGTGYVPVYLDIEHIPILARNLLQPAIRSPLAEFSNTAAGITAVVEHPHLKLTDKGMIIGFLDTGIGYTRMCSNATTETAAAISPPS